MQPTTKTPPAAISKNVREYLLDELPELGAAPAETADIQVACRTGAVWLSSAAVAVMSATKCDNPMSESTLKARSALTDPETLILKVTL